MCRSGIVAGSTEAKTGFAATVVVVVVLVEMAGAMAAAATEGEVRAAAVPLLLHS